MARLSRHAGSERAFIATAWAIALASLALTASDQPPPARTMLVRAARIIDGRGGPPIANGAVLVRGDRIERVGSAVGMTADEVIAWTRQKLAGYKCPKRVEFRDALDRTATGKLPKFKLRAPFWEGHTRQIN